MCGILGFASDKPSEEHYQVLRRLFIASAQRGRDATGIAIHKGNEILVVKQAVSAEDFIKDVLPKYKKQVCEATLVIGHTRKWTVGKPDDNNNNHPVISDNHVMVHNGCCTQVDKIDGYKYRGEVDSELLLAHVETKGIKGLEELGFGSGAVLILRKDNPTTMWLWRHHEPCHLGYDDKTNTIYVASLESYLKHCLPGKFNFFPSRLDVEATTEDHLYTLTTNGINLVDDGEIQVVRRFHSQSWNGTNSGGSVGKKTFVWDTTLNKMIPLDEWKDGTYKKWKEEQKKKLAEIQEDKNKVTSGKGAAVGVDVTALDEILNMLDDLEWDKENKCWSNDVDESEIDMEHEGEPIDAKLALDRYYLGTNTDLTHWITVANSPCYVSNDGKLVKCLDPVIQKWFITTTKMAVAEGLMGGAK